MVFVQAPQLSDIPRAENDQSEANSRSVTAIPLLQAMIEGLIDGVMLISDNGKILQANRLAQQFCRKLNGQTRSTARTQTLPPEIWRICQAVLESRELFPQHRIVPEDEIVLEDDTVLRIRAQCIQPLNDAKLCPSRSYLLVMLEDREQSIQSLAASDIQKYGLTPCEGKVWQMRLENVSYREIATRLYISENTVKKHVRSVLAKRRAFMTNGIAEFG
jgi:DNA-binding CsgD family transcriptional regulator